MDDPVWLVFGATVVLAVGFVGTGWWLIADTIRQRRHRPAHLFRGQRHAITVAELVDRAARQDAGVRHRWPEVDPDDAELVRPYARDLFPTVVLPRVEAGPQPDRVTRIRLYVSEVT